MDTVFFFFKVDTIINIFGVDIGVLMSISVNPNDNLLKYFLVCNVFNARKVKNDTTRFLINIFITKIENIKNGRVMTF